MNKRLKKIALKLVLVLVVLFVVFTMIGVAADVDYDGAIVDNYYATCEETYNAILDIESWTEWRDGIVDIEWIDNEDGYLEWNAIMDMGGYAHFQSPIQVPGEYYEVHMLDSSFGMTGAWSYTLTEYGPDICMVKFFEVSQIENVWVRAIMTLLGRNKNIDIESDALHPILEGREAE